MIKVNYEVNKEKRTHDICDCVGFLAHEDGEEKTSLYIITDENNIINVCVYGFLECECVDETIEEFCCDNKLILDKAFRHMSDFDVVVNIRD